MEYGKTNYASNEFEVVEVFRIDARMGIDLQGVVVVGRVLK